MVLRPHMANTHTPSRRCKKKNGRFGLAQTLKRRALRIPGVDQQMEQVNIGLRRIPRSAEKIRYNVVHPTNVTHLLEIEIREELAETENALLGRRPLRQQGRQAEVIGM